MNGFTPTNPSKNNQDTRKKLSNQPEPGYRGVKKRHSASAPPVILPVRGHFSGLRESRLGTAQLLFFLI